MISPIDFMLWAIAALVGFACFVVIVMLLLSLIRAITQKRPETPAKDGRSIFKSPEDHR